MKKLGLFLCCFVFVGCSDSNNAVQAQPQVDLGQFVRDEIAATADNTEPVSLNDLAFDDQTAFDPFLDLLR